MVRDAPTPHPMLLNSPYYPNKEKVNTNDFVLNGGKVTLATPACIVTHAPSGGTILHGDPSQNTSLLVDGPTHVLQ